MNDDGKVLFVLIFIAVAVVVVIYNVGRKAEFDRAVAFVSKRLRGTFEPGGFLTRPSLRFSVQGREALLEFYAGSENSPACTRVEIDVRGRSPGAMRILQEGFGQSFLKMFGAQDIQVGDRDFDALYVVKATPESLAGAVFNPERRSRVVATVRSLRNFSDPTVDLTREKLAVQVRQYLIDEKSMMRLVQCATEFLGYVTDANPSEGVQWIAQSAGPGGQCQVCGTEMKDGVVFCAKCRTPHHQECWAYMGSCSTYGCRETQHRA